MDMEDQEILKISLGMDTLKGIVSDFIEKKDKGPAEKHGKLEAFENKIYPLASFEQSLVDEIVDTLKFSPRMFHYDTFNYIACEMGFDGCCNRGRLNEASGRYEMTVYRWIWDLSEIAE